MLQKQQQSQLLNSFQSHLCIQIFRPWMTQECKRLYKNISFFSFWFIKKNNGFTSGVVIVVEE